MAEYTFVDLFAGAGGFSEGMLLAEDQNDSFKLALASDIHENAALTHQNRFREQLGIDYCFHQDDIRSEGFAKKVLNLIQTKTSKAKVDVVVGGPPCQGFALFGLRNEKDPRNDLFIHYLKVVEELQPKYFVIENVPGLDLTYGRKTIKAITKKVSEMQPIRYGISKPIKINAVDFGVPQMRERVILIGYQIDQAPIEHIPNTHTDPQVTVKDSISDLSFLKSWESATSYHKGYSPSSQYQIESRCGRLFTKFNILRIDNQLKNHEAAKHTPDVIARFAMMEPGEGFESIPKLLWNAHLSSSKKWCKRLHPNKPSFTVVTLPDDFVHYEKPRILTVREMARLQSFDDTFEFLGPRTSGGGGKGAKKRNDALPQYTQVGNATPPLMAKGIGKALLSALNGSYKEDTSKMGTLLSGMLF